MEPLTIELESEVMETVELIADLAIMSQSAVINRLCIDGLRYHYGLNEITQNKTKRKGV